MELKKPRYGLPLGFFGGKQKGFDLVVIKYKKKGKDEDESKNKGID